MINSLQKNLYVFILSIIVLFVYNLYTVNADINFTLNLMLDNAVIIFYIFTVSLVSYYFYESDKSYLIKNSSKASIKIFKFISEFIHISTVVICFNSVLIDNFLYFDFHNSNVIMYSGVAISAFSLALFVSSKISLGNNYSPCYDQKLPNKIVTSGIYKLVRHPIYLSNILLIVGVFIISGSLLIIGNFILLTSFYILSAFREERYLINKFPRYKNYSKKTGMFVPRYWK